MTRPTPERLLHLVDQMLDRRVLMSVDLVVDRFVHGTPKRISREAPVLILRFEDEQLVPGGGANAVAAVRALGGCPLPVGVVGDDAAGHGLLQIFRQRDIDTRGILVRNDYRTPTKTRILAGGRHAIKQQVVRYDVEDTLERDETLDGALAEALQNAAAGAECAVLSDYGYGAVYPELLPTVRGLMGDRPILGDSRYRLTSYRGLDGATPNLEEAEQVLGCVLRDDDRELLDAAGSKLLQRLDARWLLVTRGSAGMSLFTGGEPGGRHLPVHGTDQVADVTGAGDTVIGTFALAQAAGAVPFEAAALANYAGGVVVMKMGTATVSPTELRDAIRSDPDLLDRIA
ncbi:MAG: bifunctional ADP-heptose synthase [Thermoanaerobaculia bacterium]|nr:bifunctional ADP-heptose synthase [Thermoanaerobaculia bacterium]